MELPFGIACDWLKKNFVASEIVQSPVYNPEKPKYSNSQAWLLLDTLASGMPMDIADIGKAIGSYNPKGRMTEARRIARPHGVSIQDKWERGKNRLGHATKYKIYFLSAEDCDKVKALTGK